MLTIWYSLTSINDTKGHKNISFCEQTLYKGLIDASCSWLQSTHKNRGKNIFSRKLRAKIQFPRALFSSLRNISSYNPHTILKNVRRARSSKKYIFTDLVAHIIYRSSKYGGHTLRFSDGPYEYNFPKFCRALTFYG